MLYSALAISVSAFLLFGIQPLIARYILPWFGGTPAVWSASMLFFQTLLLGGYTYAHLLSKRSNRIQTKIHMGLIGGSLLIMMMAWFFWDTPITPGVNWRDYLANLPTLQVLTLLLISVGLPFFVLSTTGPLLQVWFSRIFPNRSPYRLYALSNAGSLLALLGYPFLVEPNLAVKGQALGWCAMYVVFCLLTGACALMLVRNRNTACPKSADDSVLLSDNADTKDADPNKAATQTQDNAPAVGASASSPKHSEGGLEAFSTPSQSCDMPKKEEAPSRPFIIIWVGLAAIASALLLATTNQMSQEVAVIPFLWVVPLALYLLSFILTFDRPIWYYRPVWITLFTLSAFFVSRLLIAGPAIGIIRQVLIYSSVLFTGCMVCHGELTRLKPSPRYLTTFYLSISIGGALGGAFVNLIAPMLYTAYWELPIAIFGVGLAATMAMLSKRWPWWVPKVQIWGFRVTSMTVLATAMVTFYGYSESLSNALLRIRTFYGIIGVGETYVDVPEYERYVLWHGQTVHGLQFKDEEKNALPTTYYHQGSAVGMAVNLLRDPPIIPSSEELDLNNLPATERSLRIGVVGLGVGTMAAYGQPGDVVRFYEINPDMVRVAKGLGGYFSYLENSQAEVDIVMGDARVSMERELARNDPQSYDLLVVDAFSSGSIPVHLLTLEAIEIYFQHLAHPDGILAIHISNRFLNLTPVIRTLAHHLDKEAILYDADGGEDGVGYSSAWMLVYERDRIVPLPEFYHSETEDYDYNNPKLFWTDKRINLFAVMH